MPYHSPGWASFESLANIENVPHGDVDNNTKFVLGFSCQKAQDIKKSSAARIELANTEVKVLHS